MRNQNTPTLTGLLAKIVVPSYLAPLCVLSVVSRLIPNRVTGRALARAALATIPIPSALAALVVTLFIWQYSIQRERPLLSVWRSATLAATVCGAVALCVTAALVATGYAPTRLFSDAIPSAIIGGAIATVKITKATLRVDLASKRMGESFSNDML